MKQYEKEWDAAKEKLERIAGHLGRVDAFCEKRNLEWKNLPPDLCEILESLESYVIHFSRAFVAGSSYLSDLNVLEGGLNQSHEIGRIKKIFSPKSLLQQVKNYDSKLSDVLQDFQVCRRFSIRVSRLTYPCSPS